MDKHKICLCISAGLDSFTTYHILLAQSIKNVCLLNIVWDGPYDAKEQKVVKELYKKAIYPMYTVSMKGYNAIASTDDHVILGRNAVVASIAAGLAPTVLINSTAYETNREMFDKNPRFLALMSFALGQACAYKRHVEDTQVLSLFHAPILPLGYGWDKPQMIQWLEDNQIYDWRKTTSCFHPTLKRCGECAVCGKRFIYESYVALQYSIAFDRKKILRKTYAKNPLQNISMLQTWAKMQDVEMLGDYSRYSAERIKIYRKVLTAYGISQIKKGQ
jgi:7-cyano-7-deazaguanine synthase in queuosine biosynthesis